MATTHYSELKIYALSKAGVENVCCEFDVETLSPTYRLLTGIPGKSNAFAISKRLGLREDIIEEAKKHITEDKESFEDVISNLESSRRIIEREKREISEYKEKLRLQNEAVERKQAKLDNSREEILKRAREEAADILKEAKEIADETIGLFRQAGENASIRELEQARDRVRNKQKENTGKLAAKTGEKPAKELTAKDIRSGDDVKILSMGLKGIINSMSDSKGNIIIKCGIMNTKAHISDLVLIPDGIAKSGKGSANKSKSELGRIKMSKSYSTSSEINLLGKTVDEAVYELDKYLDDAYIAHVPAVRIVHGKGTGVLRAAVWRKLKAVKYVESFRQGEFGEGDAGVTIARFKE